MIEFLPNSLIICLCCVVLVECDDIDNCLWVLFLLLLRDSAIIQQPLPFFRQALVIISLGSDVLNRFTYSKHASIIVVADMSNMHRILWS